VHPPLCQPSDRPSLARFYRDVDKLDKALCISIVRGDAFRPKYLGRTLAKTRAEVFVLSIGNGDSVRKSNIRIASAQALAFVLKMPEYKRIRIVVVSSTGTEDSRIIVGGGLGKLISLHRRQACSRRPHGPRKTRFAPCKRSSRVIPCRVHPISRSRLQDVGLASADLASDIRGYSSLCPCHEAQPRLPCR
jgi:hypothetical protein